VLRHHTTRTTSSRNTAKFVINSVSFGVALCVRYCHQPNALITQLTKLSRYNRSALTKSRAFSSLRASRDKQSPSAVPLNNVDTLLTTSPQTHTPHTHVCKAICNNSSACSASPRCCLQSASAHNVSPVANSQHKPPARRCSHQPERHVRACATQSQHQACPQAAQSHWALALAAPRSQHCDTASIVNSPNPKQRTRTAISKYSCVPSAYS
jgi:hypothetical protein